MINSPPRIIFKYSRIYDENWKKWIKVYKRNFGEPPSFQEIQDYIGKIELLWRGQEKKVLKELSKISKLRWKSEFIYCYVVGKCVPFSEPLTLPVYKKEPNLFIDNLIHELIHRIFNEKGNMEKAKLAWTYLKEKYKDESRKTRIHIPLYAIHSHIYLKFFGRERLERDIKRTRFLPDYKRAWEIVQREGYKDILREFQKRIA